jgi:hypothetical protein
MILPLNNWRENKMSKLLDFYEDEIHNKVRDILSECKYVSSRELGLDGRCGLVYIDEDSIVVHKSNNKSIRYYGGFEYINDEDIVEVGDFVIYLNNNSRVENCLEHYNESQEEMVE